MISRVSSHRRRAAYAAALIALTAGLLVPVLAASASAVEFDPEAIISNSNMRDYDSMSVKEIQAFLEAQSGVLDTLVTADYDKVITLSKSKNNVNATPDTSETPKPASRIIWEACQAWKINPKVMLAMLQKEQSLLTRSTLATTTLSRAIGAGCPGHLIDPKISSVATNKYPGFGNQIWYGARLLDGYGEGKNGSTIPLYRPGITVKDIYQHPSVTLHPKNLATYKLYVYNPSIGAKTPYGDLSTQACSGNANFWKIYRKHFGSTYANPRMRRVYRFRNLHNGTYLYTTSVVERYHLTSRHASTWAYGGTPFSVDTSVATTATVPYYRFYNKLTHKYAFTRSKTTYTYRRSAAGRVTWRYDGVAFRVGARSSVGSVPIYRMFNKVTRASLLTASAKTVADLGSTAAKRRRWSYKGIAFYLPRVVAAN